MRRGRGALGVLLAIGCGAGGSDREAGTDAASSSASGSGGDDGADGADDDDGVDAPPGESSSDASMGTTSPGDDTAAAESDDDGGPGSCGDGIRDPGEACDESDDEEADGCNTDCTVSGSVLWEHSQAGGAEESEDGSGVAVTPTGEAFVAGDLFLATRDLFLRGYTSEGGLGFTITIDGPSSAADAALALARDGDALYAAGYQSSTLFVARYDASGRAGWTATYADAFGGGAAANAVTTDLDGNVIVAGYGGTELDGADIFVRKYGPTGTPAWTHGYGSGSTDHARGVATDASGNVVVVGFTGAQRDVTVRKLDPGGTPLWTQTFAGVDALDDQANAVAIDGNGEVVVAGRESSVAVPALLWLRRYDPEGNEIWTQTYDGSAGEGAEALGVALDASGDIAVVGYEIVGGMSRVLVRKHAGDGTVRWSEGIDGATGTTSVGRAIAIGPDQHLWIAGGLDKGVDGRDVWIAKVAR